MNDLERLFYNLEKDLFKNVSAFLNSNKKLSDFLSTYETKVKISDKNNTINVTVEIPNLTKNHQLQIDLEQDYLIIHGSLDKENEVKDNNGGFIKERHSEYFYKTIPLPARVTKKGATASFDKGVLKVALTKIGELENRKGIDIDYKK